MSDRYSGLTGGILEASDTAKERRITYAEALELQRHRDQEYRDASQEIELNVIQFRLRGK